MKKWIADLLTAALLFGVVPATLAAAETKSTVNFQVGYGEVNVTPNLISTGTKDGAGKDVYNMATEDGKNTGTSIHIAGNSNTKTRLAMQVPDGESGLWMKAVALADGENTKIVMTTDFIRVPINWNVIVEDIVLVNYQVHPTDGMGSATNRMLTADYCGILCDYLNNNVANCKAAYFQGAAGNVNRGDSGGSLISTPENTSANPTNISGYKNFGNTMGKIAVAALNNMTTLPAGEVQSMRNETAVVERGYEEYRFVQQDVIAVGNAFAFVTAGYEMFDSNAMDLKKATKASFTDIRDGNTTTNEGGYGAVFVIENSQGHEYMPNWQTNHYSLLGGPEAYEVKESCFNEVPGTAEDLTDGLIYMLKTLNPNLEK